MYTYDIEDEFELDICFSDAVLQSTKKAIQACGHDPDPTFAAGGTCDASCVETCGSTCWCVPGVTPQIMTQQLSCLECGS